MTDIPLHILTDIVHPNNKWELQMIQNLDINQLIIKKGLYYYTIEHLHLFKNQPVAVKSSLDAKFNLGIFRPLLTDIMYISQIPISFNGNEFIVNSKTKIIYIKPKNITIMIPKNTSYNIESVKDYFYGGIFNQYLNSENHTKQLFTSIIPGYNKPNTTINNSQNNYENNFNKLLKYDTLQSSNSLLGDKLLMSNNYVKMKEPQKFALQNIEKVWEVNQITFVIPYLEKHHNNSEQLIKSIWSIIRHVNNKQILLVTNKDSFELPLDLVHHVKLYKYNGYIGTLGFENRLNVMMKNKADLASFYNNIIENFVKTDTFIIWKYNWELIEEWNIVEVNTTFPIFNYYYYNSKEYTSKLFSIGMILDNKRRYISTNDYFNICVPGIFNITNNLKIPIKCIYTEKDYVDVKNKLTQDDNRELKDFYIKMEKNEIPQYIIQN